MIIPDKRYRSLISMSLLSISFCAFGQNIGTLKFKHLSFKEGLAQSPISSILQDDQGFIWIGNWKGLSRYDGYEFRSFQHDESNKTSISNNRVNSICEDDQKNIWVGTSNGLNFYEKKTEGFTPIDIQNIKGGRNFISSIIQDNQHKIWVATFSGVKRVNTLNRKLEDINAFRLKGSADLFNGISFTLFLDQQKSIWVGTKHGVRRFNPLTQAILTLPPGLQNSAEFMQAKILVIKQDKYGDLWFGSEVSGLFRYNEKLDKLTRYTHTEADPNSLPSDWVKDILIHNDQTVWIGTRGGLGIFNYQTNSFSNSSHDPYDPDSMNDSTIWSLMEDKASNMWIGTFAGGINIFYPQNNNFSNTGERKGPKSGLNNPVVNAIALDHNGGLWIGTYRGGINYLNRQTGLSQYYSVSHSLEAKSSNGVKSLANDGNGNLWVGTLDGLCRFNKQSKTTQYFKFGTHEGKLSENLINAIVADLDGTWAATNGGGLNYLKPDGSYINFTHQPADPHSLSDNFVTALLKDDHNNLWVGTQRGLNYYDRRQNKFTYCYKKGGQFDINNNAILTLFYDSKHRLWVGTEGGGMSYFEEKTKRFHPITVKQGLTDNVVHTILEDNSGNIWVSTDNGLFKVEFKGFSLPFNRSNIRITQYTANDGLASNQFLTNSGTKTPQGELIFGGINGLTTFFPERIIKNTVKPQVVLTDFLIRNKTVIPGADDSPLRQSVTQTPHIILRYDQGFITLKFAALNYINPENNQYAYKLTGLAQNEDWHYVGTQRVANYTNLQPGDYIFSVKASNNDGLWNQQQTDLKITVLPPWWKTWWAYTLYFVLVTSVLYIILRFFKARTLLQRELYYEHLENERQKDLYQMKLDFFTNISHEIRTPLTLILGPLEKMVNNVHENPGTRNQLVTVKNNADRLMRLVTELMDFRKAETGHMKLNFAQGDIVKFAHEIFLSFQNLALSKNIRFEFQDGLENTNLYFDKDQLEKVLFNILSNAFKFTPAGQGCIRVNIQPRADETNSWVDIKISDNGKGIPAEYLDKLFDNFFQVEGGALQAPGTGIGLALSKSIVELHRGAIKVASKPAEGDKTGETMFTVSLRTGTDHFDQAQLEPEFMSSENAIHYYMKSQVSTLIENTPTGQAEKKSTILIVEDNDEVRAFIKNTLQLAYHIIESPNGLDGLDKATTQLPDLIISDVMMPLMDGLELCRRVKTDEQTNHIPVILLTARAAYIHQINGLETGADIYITKPFSIQVLELHCRNLLSSKEAMRQKFSQQVYLQPKNVPITSPEEKFLHKLMQIIEEHLDDSEFGIPNMVEQMGMSKTVLYKKVQTFTGLSIGDFIKSVRLKKAAMLIRQNKMGIAEIAFAVGFNDRKYFSKEFKKQFGQSPSEFSVMPQVTNQDQLN